MEIILAILTVILFLAIRPITVFIHEMGHALPAALFTRSKQIDVYVGSFGDNDSSWHFGKGRFRFHFKYNPLDWTHGLCSYDEYPKKRWLRYVITLGGPFSSFILGLICIVPVFYFEMHGYLQFLTISFMSSATYDLWWNMNPSDEPIVLPDGAVTFNDGHRLREMWRESRKHPLYKKGYELYRSKQHEEAAACFEELITLGKGNEEVLYMAMITNYNNGKYERVTELEKLICA